MRHLFGLVHRLEFIAREFRMAARRLLATPGFTAFAIASLALGLGITTGIYSTVASLIWNESRVPDAAHLAVITRQNPAAPPSWRSALSRVEFDYLQTGAHTVTALAASSLATAPLNDGARTSFVLAKAVTGNFFSVAQIPLRSGRGIQVEDDRAGADPVVVLSYRFWQSRAGADPTIVGRTVRLSGRPFAVVGVAADGVGDGTDAFGRPGVIDGDCWIPLIAEGLLRGPLMSGTDDPDLVVIARITPGTPSDVIASEVAGIGAALDRSTTSPDGFRSPNPGRRGWSITTAAAIGHGDPTINRAGTGVVLLVSLLLIIACTNVANLMVSRGVTRLPEFDVRRSLGASPVQLIREQCAESIILAIFSGICALLVASAICHLFATDVPIGPWSVITLRPALDTRAFWIGGACLLVTILFFGAVPAAQWNDVTLRERVAASPTARWRGRGLFVMFQISLSTALTLVAFSAAGAARNSQRFDTGIDVQRIVLGRVDFTSMGWDAVRAARAHRALEASARAQVGFESSALSAGLPLGTNQFARVSNVDRTIQAIDVAATPGIFTTLGVPLVEGRDFDGRDVAGANAVIVVSEHVARDLFGRTKVVGESLQYSSAHEQKTVTVIGVARDTDTTNFPHDRRFGAVYLPLEQQDRQSVFVIGRTKTNPVGMISAISELVRRAEPDLAVVGQTGIMAMTPIAAALNMAATLSSIVSGLAVLITMIGLYGVLSHVVSRRTREIALRMALGAGATNVRWMIVREGLRPVLFGLMIGLLLGVCGQLALRTTEFGIDIPATDPMNFAAVAALLVTVGVTACLVPARRASRVDPNVTLRSL